jgi:hypothetical protein
VALWVFVLLAGAVGAGILWQIGGWWYRKRLQWSFAASPDAELARVVYAYTSFIAALPSLAFLVIQTFLFSNYTVALAAATPWMALLLVFPLWSSFASYIAATTAFPVRRASARFWFLILPLTVFVIYLVAMAVLWALPPSRAT